MKRKFYLILIIIIILLLSIIAFSFKEEKPSLTFEITPKMMINIYQDSNQTYFPVLVEKKLFFNKKSQLSGIIPLTDNNYFDYSYIQAGNAITFVIGLVDTEEVERVIFKSNNGTYLSKEVDDYLFLTTLSNLTEHPELILKNGDVVTYPYNKK